jgi:hypothetical protein
MTNSEDIISNMSFTPNWKPLELIFNKDIRKVVMFMFMGTTREGINLYKHKITRRYLNIDDGGKTYKYNASDGSYTEIPFSEALKDLEE